MADYTTDFLGGGGMDSSIDPLQYALDNGASATTDYGFDPFSSGYVDQLNTDFGGSNSTDWGSILNGTGNVLGGLGGLFSKGLNTINGIGGKDQMLAGLMGMLGSSATKNTLMDMFNRTLTADPWNSQMGRYQEPLYQAATQGLGNTPYGQSIMDATSRKMASMGFNNSGNMAPAIATALNNATPSYLQAVAPMAMGRAPNTIGAGYLGNAIGTAEAGKYNAMGLGLQGLLTPSPQQRPSGGGGGSLLGDLGQVAGIAASVGSLLSDERLKKNIVKIADDPRGFGIYEYDLFGKREKGVLAQEVEKVIPEAVHRRFGFRTVDYRKLYA